MSGPSRLVEVVYFAPFTLAKSGYANAHLHRLFLVCVIRPMLIIAFADLLQSVFPDISAEIELLRDVFRMKKRPTIPDWVPTSVSVWWTGLTPKCAVPRGPAYTTLTVCLCVCVCVSRADVFSFP